MAKYKFYTSKRWEKLRQLIIHRDCGMCQMCGDKGVIVHHKIWVNDKNVNDPSVVWNPKNLILLCEACHNRIHFGNAQATGEQYYFDENGELKHIDNQNKIDDVYKLYLTKVI